MLCECPVELLALFRELLFEGLFSVAACSADAVELRKQGADQGEDADAAAMSAASTAGLIAGT